MAVKLFSTQHFSWGGGGVLKDKSRGEEGSAKNVDGIGDIFWA